MDDDPPPTRRSAAPGPEELERRAERLKEQVYIAFTTLTACLSLVAEADHLRPAVSAERLVIAVVGTLAAVFVADLVSHTALHGALPDRAELRHMLGVVLAPIAVLVLPLLLIGAAGLALLPLRAALTASVVVLVGTLLVVGLLAVRRLRLPIGVRLLVLLGEFALGLLVVGLEVAAH